MFPATRFRSAGKMTVLLIIAAVLAVTAALVFLAVRIDVVVDGPATRGGDLGLYTRILERVRGGEGYYPAAHAELLAGHYRKIGRAHV